MIRLTGDEAANLLAKIFENPAGRSPADMKPGQLLYGVIRMEGELLDEALICRHPQRPHVYELNCHGGVAPLQRVIKALRKLGVRMEDKNSADKDAWLPPGTFPHDVIRAEAVAMLPEACTSLASKMLLDQLNGALSDEIKTLAGSLDSHSPEKIKARLKSLLQSSRIGIPLCEPARLVVLGRPNAGKSTLVNLLLREDRVIVHEQPGATRDWIEQVVSIHGYPFLLVDTAGISDEEEEIAAIASRKSRELISSADLAMFVVDRSAAWSEEEEKLLDTIPPDRLILALNKSDIPAALDRAVFGHVRRERLIEISALTGDGLAELEDALLDAALPVRWRKGMPIVFTRRQRDLIARAVDLMDQQDMDAGTLNPSLREEISCLLEECISFTRSNPEPGETVRHE